MARIIDTPEARKARRAVQQREYDKRATRGIYLKFNRGTDAEVLEELDRQPNKQAYIRRLILEDIARRGE